MSLSNYFPYGGGRSSADSPMPQPPAVPSREAASEDLYHRDAQLPVAAGTSRLEAVDSLLRSSAAQQQQEQQQRHQAYPSAAASASVAVDPYPYSDAALRTLLARRLAAAVVADRTGRLAHERLMHDVALLEEQQRIRERQLASTYGTTSGREPYPHQVQSEYARPRDVDSVAAALPLPPAQQRPAERPYHAPALPSAGPPPRPSGSSASGGKDDEEARVLRAEAEACMALSLLGGRRMSGVVAVATTEDSASDAADDNKSSPTQRIVSPGASPSPPLSTQQQQLQQVKVVKRKKTTKKVSKNVDKSEDTADSGAAKNSGAAKKRKKTDDADAGAEDKPKKKKGRKKENGMPRRPLSAYNIFFSEERERILGENGGDGPPQQSTAERAILERRFSNPSSTPSGPAKTMQEQASNKRRKHRRTHGKIGFRDLARTIGQRWKSLPEDRMSRYKRLAKIDMERYQEELAAYRRGKMIREVARTEEGAQGAQSNVPSSLIAATRA